MQAEARCGDAVGRSVELRARAARTRADAAALRSTAGGLLNSMALTREASSAVLAMTQSLFRQCRYADSAVPLNGRQAFAVPGPVLDESFDAASLHLLRERVAACAAAAGMPEDKAVDVVIAVHEVAANAVVHGAGTGRLVLRAAGGELRCQVSDAGPGPALWLLRHGHGLWLIHQVADQVSVSSGPNGFRVNAVFTIHD